MRENFVLVDSLEIDSDFSSINNVELFIDEMCLKLSVSDDLYGNVLIAVSEAVNNAIQHGNQFSKTLKVTLNVCDSEQVFNFSVSDKGNGFDVTNLPDPTSPENVLKENGRGVFLMKNLADEVEFLDNGSLVNLYFNK
jgi:serine/threonine-protein kinase RsbW